MAALAACLTAASVALGAATAPSGRPPIPGVATEYAGMFDRGFGSILLRVEPVSFRDPSAVAGIEVIQVSGRAPATCRDRGGKAVTPARGGSIDFGGARNEPIGPVGAFAFRIRPTRDLPFDLTISGTFHGNNVVGRVRGTSGKGGSFDSCKADARFWAWRTR